MNNPFRYLSALCVNLFLPWIGYHLAFPHWGYIGGLVASAVPLLVWIAWDLGRLRHFDALSAVVLAGIALSLVAAVLVSRSEMRIVGDPMIFGMIGVAFLLSLLLPRPMVYYLARSTLARESKNGAIRFERRWREWPELVGLIRRLTVVWGIGLIAQNLARGWISLTWTNSQSASIASELLRYGGYGALMLWTLVDRRLYRRSVHRGTGGLDDDTRS
ncbi:hypothetical protein N0A02_00265 [Paraburkholderia acidicola]|uniref:Intracellular septation protein A n=1 Tax=Paraburkholderia acidicola TaxID=1912599 RepID=A0ABV1LEV2_9BURK